MKIFVGADHRGYVLKGAIVKKLKDAGYDVEDTGTHEKGVDCDYPALSFKIAMEVAKSDNNRGILICMTGLGHVIAANKVPGAYAALCYNKEAAAYARRHNNSNILVLGAKFTSEEHMGEIVDVWLREAFEGGRHARRLGQIKEIEKRTMKDLESIAEGRT